MNEIVCAGFGGQGVLTMGLIIAKTGMDNEYNVTWIPSYGSEMRGGTANCNVKINDTEIPTPFIKEIDTLIAMNEPSLDKFAHMVRPGGVVIANSSIITKYNFREDVTVVSVGASEIAAQNDNKKGANIVMLGAFAAVSDTFTKEVMGKGIEDFFALKGKNNPNNKVCFEEGVNNAIVKTAKS